MRYEFGDFRLDGDTRQLLREGREVALGPKAFELLELLLRARPRALSRTRLHAALWPSTHVGATSLHVLVSQLRAALGDDPDEPLWVRTVYGFGYAFRGEAASDEPVPEGGSSRPCLVLDDREWPLSDGEHVLGREEGLALRIESRGVSRHHARLLVRSGQATLEDLASKNGTFVAEERVIAPRVLADGDVIRLGRRVRLLFRDRGGDPTETEASEG
jgi:DNA-binding winged helix-turn-helix (wHTH) protein